MGKPYGGPLRMIFPSRAVAYSSLDQLLFLFPLLALLSVDLLRLFRSPVRPSTMSTEKQIHAAPAAPPQTDTKGESKEEHIDRLDPTVTNDVDEKPIQDDTRDHTGAHRKTDPEEIKLVRKLDYRIMVRPSPKHTPIDQKQPLLTSMRYLSPSSAPVCRRPGPQIEA